MYKSRLPQIADEIDDRMDGVTGEAAKFLEARAKAHVPVRTGRLRTAIHTERYGAGKYAVIAGNYEVFYGHIVEHGGVYTPAQPFMTPASEETTAIIQVIGVEGLRGL